MDKLSCGLGGQPIVGQALELIRAAQSPRLCCQEEPAGGEPHPKVTLISISNFLKAPRDRRRAEKVIVGDELGTVAAPLQVLSGTQHRLSSLSRGAAVALHFISPVFRGPACGGADGLFCFRKNLSCLDSVPLRGQGALSCLMLESSPGARAQLLGMCADCSHASQDADKSLPRKNSVLASCRVQCSERSRCPGRLVLRCALAVPRPVLMSQD